MTSGAAVVRRAGIRQLDEAAALFDSYRQFYGYPADAAAARDYLEARLKAGESVVLLAYLDDTEGAVGFSQLYPSFCSLDLAPIFVLYDLFVAPRARRRGVAQSLLTAAGAHGRKTGASRLELSTALDNTPAQTLYESLGWMPDSTYRHYELPLR
ncbi:GNAT family N-acetyltransferase [Subtercola endophyticus]|uniref:GNAT family N-acetyltransferase n=1 Tax=Subtercola endophyticus TaxID=2895559 RepID=UPI001E3966C5|nr:GNAT family N-acetyltransferase [Subtercola endophyticus]UFS59595.1 GNAT family N-acetyltransferase [Subtercola endophyticus]